MKISLEISIDDVKIRDTYIEELPEKPAIQEDKPDCKARRFLLIDEAANITEGVKWGNGFVVLDHEQLVGASRYLFRNWEELKEHNPGSGVQWIDQEVAE